jgi:hypothetical protein
MCSHYAVTVCVQIKLAFMEQRNLNEKHSNLLFDTSELLEG